MELHNQKVLGSFFNAMQTPGTVHTNRATQQLIERQSSHVLNSQRFKHAPTCRAQSRALPSSLPLPPTVGPAATTNRAVWLRSMLTTNAVLERTPRLEIRICLE